MTTGCKWLFDKQTADAIRANAHADGAFHFGQEFVTASRSTMDQHEERIAVAALFAEQLAKARHIIATTEARIAASKGPIEQMAEALSRREVAFTSLFSKEQRDAGKRLEPTHLCQGPRTRPLEAVAEATVNHGYGNYFGSNNNPMLVTESWLDGLFPFPV